MLGFEIDGIAGIVGLPTEVMRDLLGLTAYVAHHPRLAVQAFLGRWMRLICLRRRSKCVIGVERNHRLRMGTPVFRSQAGILEGVGVGSHTLYGLEPSDLGGCSPAVTHRRRVAE